MIIYTIGEISKIVRISANALRYYDEAGVIKPEKVDADSRYRYYSEEQINDILFIQELKSYGFPLAAIKELLRPKDNERLRQALKKRLDSLLCETDQSEAKIKMVQRRLEQLEGYGAIPNNLRILVVDDISLERMVIKNIVEGYGYKVAGEASNGKEGIKKYEDLKPDLVIIGICMPEMDGIYASARIKEKHPEAKIVICSSMSQTQLVLEAFKAGANDFVAKPFAAERLSEAMAGALNGQGSINCGSICFWENNLKMEQLQAESMLPLEQEQVDLLITAINGPFDSELFNQFINDLRKTYKQAIQSGLFKAPMELKCEMRDMEIKYLSRYQGLLAEEAARQIKSSTGAILLHILSELIDGGAANRLFSGGYKHMYFQFAGESNIGVIAYDENCKNIVHQFFDKLRDIYIKPGIVITRVYASENMPLDSFHYIMSSVEDDKGHMFFFYIPYEAYIQNEEKFDFNILTTEFGIKGNSFHEILSPSEYTELYKAFAADYIDYSRYFDAFRELNEKHREMQGFILELCERYNWRR